MKWREYGFVVAKLRAYDGRFEIHTRRGKGSHRMIVHPDIDGNMRHYPLPYHGPKTPVAWGMLKDLIRIFQLPSDIFDY